MCALGIDFLKCTMNLFFSPNEELLAMRDSDWEEITEEVFNHLFELSAIKRTKIEGLKRNIKFVKG